MDTVSMLVGAFIGMVSVVVSMMIVGVEMQYKEKK